MNNRAIVLHILRFWNEFVGVCHFDNSERSLAGKRRKNL